MAKEPSKKKVFVSSTWEDLEAERASVLEGIRHLQFEHIAMEYFGSDPRQPIEVCLEKVRESDVYVGIIGYRYGTLDEKTGKSLTQLEYEEAIHRGLSCLIYIRSDEYPIPPKFVDKDPEAIRKLESFKVMLKKQHTPAYFNNANDLAIKVVIDLSKLTKGLDYEVLDRVLEVVTHRFRRIQEDNDSKFHYLQRRLEELGLIKTIGATCPVCGRLLEDSEPSFGAQHPVCAECLVYRTDEVRMQLVQAHPEFLAYLEPIRRDAQKYLKGRSKTPK